MNDSTREQLGPPALRLAGFQLWVHGRQFPESQDGWDGNWLNVATHCGGAGASVWANGAILDTVSVLRFREGLEALHRTLSGVAVLESVESNVGVRIDASDRAGHVRTRVEITPDHLAQGHWFEFDQTYLPPVIAQCAALGSVPSPGPEEPWCLRRVLGWRRTLGLE